MMKPTATELLDRMSPARFDVLGAVDLLNEFEELDPDEQDRYYEAGSALGFAGVDPHPFTALCSEAHNAFLVLRDLDGSLQFVFERFDVSVSRRVWAVGPLYQGHISGAVTDTLVTARQDLEALQVSLSGEELQTLLAALPDDPPGPLRTF